MAGPLADIVRVLDISERSPAAAIAGMVLADLGAEVIRVEPKGGDSVRALDGTRVWLRGQKSVTVGSSQVESGQWETLRNSADVILDTAQPWTYKPAGLLEGFGHHPRQILAVLTAYPRSVHELAVPDRGAAYPVCGELIEAQYGLQHFQQGTRQGPIFLGWPHAIYGSAWLLTIGILGAILERERTGAGQAVTTSLLDGVAILSTVRWLGGEKLGPRLLTGSRITTRHNNVRLIVGLFECGDGNWIQLHTGPRGAFDRMLKIVGRDDLMAENAGLHILGIPLEPATADDLWNHLARTFKTKPADYWCGVFATADVSCMPALMPGDALWLDQMERNGLVDILPDGERHLGKLVKYERTPIEIGREIPAIGEHNASLFPSADGGSDRTFAGVKGPTTTSKGAELPATRVGPLDGILALDFGAHMAGPFANRLFADLGARVIKIEEYGGDPMRGPQLSLLLGVQRGKESLAIDLKSDAGRKVVYDLVCKADIVHHNMRAGAMERLGMGWEQLRAINPRLIYCHSSGYGNDGAWSRLPTFEPLHSALTGMLSRTGGEGNPPDHYLTHMDYGCGLTSCAMTIAALVERERSGVGQYLEVPQTGAGLLAMSDVHGYRDRKFETFPLDYDQRGHAPTNALYRTADGWVVIACYSDREWNGLRRALDLTSTLWPAYAEVRQQRLGTSETARAIETALAQLNTSSALRRLRAEAVPCTSPAPFEPSEVITDPTMLSRGLIVVEQHYDAGEVREVGHTLRFGNSNAMTRQPAPVTGQHSVAILRELGRSAAEIEALITGGVVNAARPARASKPAEERT